MSYEQFLTSKSVITKQATMPDGTVSDVHFVKCAHVDFVRWQQAEQSGKPADVERGKQVFISKCLVDAEGNPALSEAKSLHLTAEGVNVLFPLALEASGVIKRKEPGNGSGEEASSTSSDTSP